MAKTRQLGGTRSWRRMPSRKGVKSGGHGEGGCCRVLKQKHRLGSEHQPFM